MSLKEEVHQRCLELVNERINLFQKTLRDLTESAGNESKSTAGDKHETALAMLQIEQENIGRQLKEALLQKAELNKINPKLETLNAVHGSLIKTNKGYFFVSVALGKISVDGNVIIALSPLSPLGNRFLKLKANDTAEMNGTTYNVEHIS